MFNFRININLNRFCRTYLSTIIKDLLTPRIVLISFAPCIVLALIWIALFIVGLNNFDWFLGHFPELLVSYSKQSGVFNTIIYILLSIFAFLVMIFYIVIIVGICSMIINCFISPIIVEFVYNKHYSNIKLNPEQFPHSFILATKLFIKTLAKFIFFLILCYGLTLIGLGFIGGIVSLFLYFRFFCLNLNFEVGLSIMTDLEFKNFSNYYKIPIMLVNYIIFILLYIPIVNFFILPLQILILSHSYLHLYSKISKNELNYDYIHS